MESRFFRFGKSKRNKSRKSQPKAEPVSASTEPITLATPDTINTRPSDSRNAAKLQKPGEHSLALKGLSYDSLAAGRAPVFGNVSQAGNGPVKLQTSRRLSSGELLVTMQDNKRTLEDIREGEYIIGGKDKRNSMINSTDLPDRRAATSHGYYRQSSRSSRPSTSRSARVNGDSTWSTTPITPASMVRPSETVSKINSNSPTSTSVTATKLADEESTVYDFQSSCGSSTGARNNPSKPKFEQNATIAALWKAEYGRLVKIYGQEGVDRDVCNRNNASVARTSSKAVNTQAASLALVTLDPLPHPGFDGIISKRSSTGSGKSSEYSDDTSEVSSNNRESSASSWAAQSARTTQTSFSEAESPATREDIRKMIEQMRSNYIQAIESQSPPPSKVKSVRKKKRPRPTASPNMDRKKSHSERKTWHGEDNNAKQMGRDRFPKRTTSNPARSLSRLSPIEASPSRSTSNASVKSTPDLKRADSMTLGGLMGLIPENPEEINESEADKNLTNQSRSGTPQLSNETAWLPPDLSAATLLSALSPQDDGEALSRANSGVDMIVESAPATKPTSSTPAKKAASHHPPARPPPPSTSLAELVNFI